MYKGRIEFMAALLLRFMYLRFDQFQELLDLCLVIAVDKTELVDVLLLGVKLLTQ